MANATIRLHPSFTISSVDERIFGGFLEHLGRAVYEGVYDPASKQADEDGFRKDVVAALGRLQMTAMRYPGGNFASGYHWLDGVGPKDRRPIVRELAWQSIETNAFGTDEFIRLCRKLNWQPMLTANMGTGTPEEARDWVEYCNCPTGTRYADLRAANGFAEPHQVKLWCLGNEMDGQWQLGHVPADQYAIRAQQAAKMMKDTDPSIELIACGSCGFGMPTYMEWDRQVLEYLGDYADYVSLHRYVGNREGDTADFLSVGLSIDKQIEEMDAACRFVQAKRRARRRPFLCFDEWNVWYRETSGDGRGQRAPHLLEEVYNLEDALVAAQFFNSFIRHADVLKIANIAQIVNVIAPVLTRGDDLLVQSIFYAFEMFSKRRRGMSLRLSVEASTYENRNYGVAPLADASAILDGNELKLFVVNRSTQEALDVRVEIFGGEMTREVNAEILTGTDPKAHNTFERPDVVRSMPFEGVQITGGRAVTRMPALSLVAATFRIQ